MRRRSPPTPWPGWSVRARAVILPVLSEATGLPVIEAIACGTPVVASAVGPLPELVGPAGLLVEPGEPDRLAVALATVWADDGVHHRIATAARARAKASKRSWADVARDTRSVYAEVGIRRGRPGRRRALTRRAQDGEGEGDGTAPGDADVPRRCRRRATVPPTLSAPCRCRPGS